MVLSGGRRPTSGHGRTGTAGPASLCVSSSAAHSSCAEQSYGEERRELLLIAPRVAEPAMGCRVEQDVSTATMGAASTEGPTVTGERIHMASPARAVTAQGLAPERGRLLASGLSEAVVNTIQSARAPSTCSLYTLK